MSRAYVLSMPILRRTLLKLCLPFLLGMWTFPVSAQQLAFRTYSQVDGLTNAWASCLQQDASGFIIICTEHGLFAYDGRHFFNFGPKQGLPDGGFVHSLTFDAKRRIIVRYSHAVYVADQPIGENAPPATINFRPAYSANGIDDDQRGEIVQWKDGAVFTAQGRLYFVRAQGKSSTPLITSADDLLHGPGFPLQDATPIATSGAAVWVARSDGEICRLSDAGRTCFGPHDGLPQDYWAALLVFHGHVLVRSANRLADIDPNSGRIELSSLPNQGGRYANYPHSLLLAETPAGQLLTQSSDGLMIREATGWRVLTKDNGLPTAPILSVLFDRERDLWLGVLGKGVMRGLGYGLWENLDHHDGLSNDVVWQMAREPNGPLWVANDEGVDAVGPSQHEHGWRHFDNPSFAVSIDGYGHLWRSEGSTGIACITLSNGGVERFNLPLVDKILLGSRSHLWFVTERGLYVIDDAARPRAPQPVRELAGPITTAVIGADGSLWAVRQRQLVHLHVDGTIHTIPVAWRQPDFEPLTLAVAKTGIVWAGGAGAGLYRLALDDDHVASMTQFGPPDIVSNTVVSILIDSRAWVWVGTDNGVSVFDGKRWVSANTDNGLVWNDLDQDSLYEDADHSMWLGTSQGLSHLLNPARLFHQSTLQPVITSVQLGRANYRGVAVDYSRDPLLVEFGVLNFQSDGLSRFRYRLEGVDKDWAETASGFARYPSIPTGHHRFEVVAFDPLTHQASQPVSILLRMRRPWWVWWPLLVVYVALACGAAYGLLRLRIRILIDQRRALEREVEVQTREIRQAQAELQLLATQDNLTKLLTRGEVQSRLDRAMADTARNARLTIGLLDIDHFKYINDRFGHLAGDEILREIGSRLRGTFSSDDYAGRYGGEEILIVLDGYGPSTITRMHSLSGAICEQLFLVGDEMISVTCSIGVTQALPHDNWKSLIGRADSALYKAKAQGRNRIVVSLAATVDDIPNPVVVRSAHAAGKAARSAKCL